MTDDRARCLAKLKLALESGSLDEVTGSGAIDWHARYGALVLACPRQDMTRLWPLPMMHPWFEDGDPRYSAA